MDGGAARNLPKGKTPDGFGIKVDDSYLKLHPDPLGPQHDEREPGYLGGRFKWEKGLREVQEEAILHSTVLDRLAAKDGVQHYYERLTYRPENLKNHLKAKQYYTPKTNADDSPRSESRPDVATPA
ncbi:hypothetical protein ABIB00_003888 [Bradyrhizobium sp. LB14.3]|uniref:hypothetical protein n=1 Tax=Bradyrhizobium sp. LB14.3 TaxID=3156328 RepID=UPI00339B9A1E